MNVREFGATARDNFQTFLLPGQRDNVPSSFGGLYQFCVRFPSDYELGFQQSPTDLARICKVLIGFLTRVMPILGLGPLSGSLSTSQSGLHLRTTYKIAGGRSDIELTRQRFLQLMQTCEDDLEELRRVTRAMRLAFSAAPPIYVGLAVGQSLRARLDQHLAGSSTVAAEIQRHGLSWTNIEYRCVTLDTLSLPRVRALEQTIQSIFKPSLSER
jgi:hypothetical protein